MLQMDTEEKKYKLFRFFLSNEDNNKTEDENSIFIYTFILSIGHKRMLFFLLCILYLCIYIYIYIYISYIYFYRYSEHISYTKYSNHQICYILKIIKTIIIFA